MRDGRGRLWLGDATFVAGRREGLPPVAQAEAGTHLRIGPMCVECWAPGYWPSDG